MNTVLEPEPVETAPAARTPIEVGPCPDPLEELTTQPEPLAEGLATTTEEKPDEPHPHIRKNLKTAIRVLAWMAILALVGLALLVMLAPIVAC